MKHLVNGAALAAVLAIAVPAWAQAPATPGVPAPHVPGAAAPAHRMAADHLAPHQMHHRRKMRHMAARPMATAHAEMHGRHMPQTMAANRMTEELNRAELARLKAGDSGAAMQGVAPMPEPGPTTAPPPGQH